LFTAALELIGVQAEEYTVDSPGWPIITNDHFGDAEPIIKECRKAVELSLKPLLNRGVTPVVSGFVGRSQNGMITTLGRGGTDTTATVLARCLGADELVLVKDVGGVYSADPHLVEGSEILKEISTKDAYLLSGNGAKVLHDKVFRHKNPELDIRIISRGEALAETGTVVRGDLPSLEVSVGAERIHEASLVGEGATHSQVVQDAVDRITSIGGVVHSVEATEGRLAVCFTHDALTALKTLHELVAHHGLKSISLKENLRRVTVQGKDIDALKAEIPSVLGLGGVYRVKIDQTGVSFTVEERALDEVLGFF
jgi:aspartate kinase